MFCGHLIPVVPIVQIPITKLNEAKDFELILPPKEDLDAWVDWHPPMILEQYGSFKRTSFSNGYELPDPTEGRAKMVKNNCPIIKKWNIPILGEIKPVKTLTDVEGNEISLKIETGHYWLPGTASKYRLELSLLEQQVKKASSRAARHSAVKSWKNGLKYELKVAKEDIKNAKKDILNAKKAGTKITILKSVQAKVGLYDPKSDFYSNLTNQEGRRDIWSQKLLKVKDILAEQQNWIEGLEKQKAEILRELKKVTIKS